LAGSERLHVWTDTGGLRGGGDLDVTGRWSPTHSRATRMRPNSLRTRACLRDCVAAHINTKRGTAAHDLSGSSANAGHALRLGEPLAAKEGADAAATDAEDAPQHAYADPDRSDEVQLPDKRQLRRREAVRRTATGTNLVCGVRIASEPMHGMLCRRKQPHGTTPSQKC
jgi:hypothetical protein